VLVSVERRWRAVSRDRPGPVLGQDLHVMFTGELGVRRDEGAAMEDLEDTRAPEDLDRLPDQRKRHE